MNRRNNPHPRASVEGYYSKFDLSNGAHIVLVLCSVRTATNHKPHMLSFTYHPPNIDSYESTWQRQCYDKVIEMRRLRGEGMESGFELRVPGVGSVCYFEDGSARYELDFNDFAFRGWTRDALPWGRSGGGQVGQETSPEGWLTYVPLIPLHWHVSSLGSRAVCEVEVRGGEHVVPRGIATERMSAVVHQEKNWGVAFPKSHMWVQAWNGDRESGICLAGGAVVPGVRAFLVGYRSADVNLDFRPPFCMQLLGLSPFLKAVSRWETRRFELDVSTLTTRLCVSAQAPMDSFFTLGAPFAEGHRDDALGQSFRATVQVTVYRRPWVIGKWEQIKQETFERASLEFGGAYFGGLRKTQ